MTSIFEKNGGTYRNENGILIRNLKAPESNKEIGKYGSLHKKFIKKTIGHFTLHCSLKEHCLTTLKKLI